MLIACTYRWSSQPEIPHSKGCGNILILAAEFAGIKYFIYPEINRAWEKNQEEQFEEIREPGGMLPLALDGQCDSPGHNATYNTVTAQELKQIKY